ncbi:MAG: zf-HC2 domain-containing protein [Candidatus Rokubacteria bacterium]|nr:zf-HC2 domain-containing protein [Candidatus Rokubacteria bacterium]
MSCHEARELFSAKMDGFLTPAERSALDRHLQACADCSREWQRFSRTVGLLRAVPEARAPAGFGRRVLEAATRERWPRRLLRRVFVPLHVKLPLEAAALIAVSTLVILLYRQPPEFQRAAGPPVPGVTAPAAESPGKVAPYGARQEPEAAMEKGQPAGKEEAVPAERPSVGGRTDVSREARKSAAPAPESKVAARAQGPFHLVGLLRATSRETLDSQLGDLVKQVGGILVRDADRVGPGSIVEVIIPREAYPRLLAGLRQIGDFTVETRAKAFPDQVRIGIRIAN